VPGERFAGVAADETGAASDENGFHRSIVFSASVKRNDHWKGRLCVSTVSIVCTRLSGRPNWPPRAYRPDGSDDADDMPSQQPCCFDDADGDHPPPFMRYPSFCSSSQSIPTALERRGPITFILIIRTPDRPSRANAISMSSMRRNVWARRSRPASTLGFFAHGGVMDTPSRALSAHSRKRSEALSRPTWSVHP
jgi:hypothetical protein